MWDQGTRLLAVFRSTPVNHIDYVNTLACSVFRGFQRQREGRRKRRTAGSPLGKQTRHTQKTHETISTMDETIIVAHSTASVVDRDSDGESDCGAPGTTPTHSSPYLRGMGFWPVSLCTQA